jgi:hypothetical protein
VHRTTHPAGPRATLAAVGVTATVALTGGCGAHPPLRSRPAAVGRSATPVSSGGVAGGAAPTPAPTDPAPATVVGTADRGAILAAAAFVRAALPTGPTAGRIQRTRRYSTTRMQRLAPPAPPAAGLTRVLSAQLAADTPSTAGTAQVEVAALVTPAGGNRVPVTTYLTLTRTPAGWLVDAVSSWT